jgi:hypothetical protein
VAFAADYQVELNSSIGIIGKSLHTFANGVYLKMIYHRGTKVTEEMWEGNPEI